MSLLSCLWYHWVMYRDGNGILFRALRRLVLISFLLLILIYRTGLWSFYLNGKHLELSECLNGKRKIEWLSATLTWYTSWPVCVRVSLSSGSPSPLHSQNSPPQKPEKKIFRPDLLTTRLMGTVMQYKVKRRDNCFPQVPHLHCVLCRSGDGGRSDAQHTVGVTVAIGVLRFQALSLLHHHVEDNNRGLQKQKT